MLLDRTDLPRTGTSFTFTTSAGQRAGVVAHRDGRRDLVLHGPDGVERTIALTDIESRTVAELLGASAVADRVPHLELAHLEAVHIPVPASSPYGGRRLADLRTKASVVAILRDGRTIDAPSGDVRLRHGDALVAVGAEAAIRELRRSLDH
ncbi:MULTISPECIES: cation:proton antiporter regulatory subunit [Actinomadura]|uniref:cation:proton antiporter regulatory subunit n=1 Tax=Actinomadura TaxID=1988 RepID=UPI00041B99B1|nr:MULTISPECIES: TrkA C-terminal domain-containing protein [Actinomadura]RSN66794.1 potassium transporter TrkA [Actinomadura sp. WAC 06369]